MYYITGNSVWERQPPS